MKYENFHVCLRISKYGYLSMYRKYIGKFRPLECSRDREAQCSIDCPLFRLHFSEDGTMTANFGCGESTTFYYVDYLKNDLVESEVSDDSES